mgnify:CR=1 FL=1
MPVINASTSGPGGIQMGGDASGNLQLQSAGNTIATISSTGLTMNSGNIVQAPNAVPAFSAVPNQNQSVTSGSEVKVSLQTKLFDTANAFDNTTNYRFQPTVAGYYQINAQIASLAKIQANLGHEAKLDGWLQANKLNDSARIWQYLLIESGLSVENIKTKVPVGPPLDKAVLSKSIDSWGSATLDNIAKGVFTLDKVTTSNGAQYQLMQNITSQRVCVNKYRAEELLGKLLSSSAYCSDSPHYPRSDDSYAKVIKAYESEYPYQKNI